jgi:hypothetical protein
MTERTILNRLSQHIRRLLTKEQAGFRPGKSPKVKLLNLTKYIEDGYEKKYITVTAFMDLSAAYDTVNHKCFIWKVYKITDDNLITKFITVILDDSLCVSEIKRAYIENRKMVSLKEVSLHPFYLISIQMTNQFLQIQLVFSMLMTYVLPLIQDFSSLENTLESAFSHLSQYYDENQLCANTSKT